MSYNLCPHRMLFIGVALMLQKTMLAQPAESNKVCLIFAK
jgi:hypothetical protein